MFDIVSSLSVNRVTTDGGKGGPAKSSVGIFLWVVKIGQLRITKGFDSWQFLFGAKLMKTDHEICRRFRVDRPEARDNQRYSCCQKWARETDRAFSAIGALNSSSTS